MIKKIDILKGHAASGNWNEAIKIAAKFPRLGKEKKDITRAWEAIIRPSFMVQLKQDPEHLIRIGIAALKSKYKI